MANVLGELFQDIADAIRSKTGSTDTLKPNQFPEAIEGITAGGGGSSADERVKYVTFVYEENGETKEHSYPVIKGDTCHDPAALGLINPTKASTAQYNYTFYGWGASDGGAADANILKNITKDKTVYAIFTATVRYYTITYYDSDGTTVLKTESLAYGKKPSYTPIKSGYNLIGWIPAVSVVTGNASYTAQWEVSTVVDEEISDSWDDIIAAANNGTYKEKYKLGNWKKLTFTQPYSTTQWTLTMQIVAFDSDRLADGSGYAPITWVAKEVYNYFKDIISASYAGWSSCNLRNALHNDLPKAILETNVVSAVKEVVKSQIEYVGNGLVTQTSMDKFWIPSYKELNSNSTSGANYCEVYRDDASRIKIRGYGDMNYAWWLRDTYSYSSWSSYKNRLVTSSGIFSSGDGRAGGAGYWALGFCI